MQSVEAGQRHREREAIRSRKNSLAARDIAPLPAMKNPQRRMKAKKDLRYFCEQYFPEKFKLAWSKNHLRVLKELQEALIQGGGKVVLAMPRGEGKSTITETAGLWAIMYGHCRFIVIVGATKDDARKIIDNIKAALETNDTLLEDFPEAVYPFQKLNGSALLARGQTFMSKPTKIQWKPDMVVFPSIAGNDSAGAVILTVGIKGSIRGKSRSMPGGEIARPDTVILDDVQTDADARSPNQVAKLEDIINKTIQGLVGPAEELAMIMPCTVIQDGDLSDRYLNHKLYPQWKALRFKMIETMPDRMDLWEKYADIRKDDPVAATMFYKRNRTEMKAGAVVSWEANYTGDELDALQHGMNKWADNFESFCSEYQNEPFRPDMGTVVVPDKTIRSRLNGLERQTRPMEAPTLVGMVDIHDDILYFAVAAFADDRTGFIVDYGTYPEQRRRLFSKGDKNLITLQKKGGDDKLRLAVIQAGLVTLLKNLLAVDWVVEGDSDGAEVVHFSKILVDSGYVPKIVENAIRLVNSPIVQASKGVGIKASEKPMESWFKKPGRRMGTYWMEDRPNGRSLRTITYDTNYWKCQVHDAFSVGAGSRGGLTLWGHDAEQHRMFSEHLNAEKAVLVESSRNKVNEWTKIPGRDNHLFDCIVGTLVAASVAGIKPAEENINTNTVRRRIAQ